MKLTFLLIFLLYSLSASAQQNLNPYDSNFIQYRFKGYVVLNNKDKIKIEGLSFTDSLTVRLYTNTTSPKNIPATYKGDVSNMTTRMVSVYHIKILKGKRMAFFNGAGVGAVLGYGAGHFIGYNSYEDRPNLTPEENEDKKEIRAFYSGALVAVPIAAVGGLISSVFVQRKFRITGDKQKLDKALQKLYK